MSDKLQFAGGTAVESIKLISKTNQVVSLLDFLVELDIFEDIFSNVMKGFVTLSDSRNLIQLLPITGEEYIVIKVRTPSFPDQYSINKTFRVYKITDRQIVNDTSTQVYTLHFSSVELFYDILLPLFVPFEGFIHDVVEQLYLDYINTIRTYDVNETEGEAGNIQTVTPLIMLNPTDNHVKFVAPGWTPFKCINWMASKSIPKDGLVAKNFLFFESNKAFYFGSIEHLFRDAAQFENYIGTYSTVASNIRIGTPYRDIGREFFIAQDFTLVDSTDFLKNYTNGYMANRLVTLDLYTKDYKLVDYDYVSNYRKQYHTSGSGPTSVPFFDSGFVRNPAASISFYPVNDKLYNDFPDNISVKMEEIYGNRLSSLLDLSNIRMNITVPGRTDIEVGNLLYFSFPPVGPRAEVDIAKSGQDMEDKLFSGYYLITSIRHMINRQQHKMVMEIIKDSAYLRKDII